jgi:hypothetical protein
MSNRRSVFFVCMAVFAISSFIGLILSISQFVQSGEELEIARQEEKAAKQQVEAAGRDLAYEYGKCVFYDKISVEECNRAAPNGLEVYEKYYGDGSWTFGGDPDAST